MILIGKSWRIHWTILDPLGFACGFARLPQEWILKLGNIIEPCSRHPVHNFNHSNWNCLPTVLEPFEHISNIKHPKSEKYPNPMASITSQTHHATIRNAQGHSNPRPLLGRGPWPSAPASISSRFFQPRGWHQRIFSQSAETTCTYYIIYIYIYMCV